MAPPRKMVWADIGGRPVTTSSTSIPAMTKYIARVVCKDVYAAVYRLFRKAEIASTMQAMSRNTAIISALNGIVIPTTSTKRSRFRIPTTCNNDNDNVQPLTAEKRAKLFGLHAAKQSDIQAPQAAVHLTTSDDQDFDVFGHGGGLD